MSSEVKNEWLEVVAYAVSVTRRPWPYRLVVREDVAIEHAENVAPEKAEVQPLCRHSEALAGYAVRDARIAELEARRVHVERETDRVCVDRDQLRAELAAIKGQVPVQVDYVAVMRDDGEGGLEPEWLMEGGTAEMLEGMHLCCVDGGALLFEEGSGELYAAPTPSAVVMPSKEIFEIACKDTMRQGHAAMTWMQVNDLYANLQARLNPAPARLVPVPLVKDAGL